MIINKVGIASDHAGFEMKKHVISFLKEKGIEVIDYGAYTDERSDYPDFGHDLANSVENGDTEMGFSLCGSGNGINMTTNKHIGIRGALCWTREISGLARSHNNANICSLPARFITKKEAEEIIDEFLHTKFEGGRHKDRINKIPL